jgi:uncharacterized damage-inducible protein DinB
MTLSIARPAASEFASFYAGYIARVPDSGPVAELNEQIAALEKLKSLPDDKANHAYADGKWTVKEVLGHCADGERVFSYRLTRIARGDKTPLAGFDENEWAKTAPHRRRSIAAVIDEFIAVRRATLALMDSLDETAIANTGIANNNPVSGRAICWIIAGHARHHLNVLHERYGI